MARAVLLDMEPKVISKCLARRGVWSYDTSRVHFQQSGSGNNWAYGYNHGPWSLAAVLQLVDLVGQQG